MSNPQHEHAGSPQAARWRLPAGARTVGWACAAVGVVALLLATWLGHSAADGWRGFIRSYLVAWCFWATISLGGLFFTAVQHTTRAGWSVSVRRLAELCGAVMPVLAVLFLPLLVPVLVGSDALYPWVAPEAVAASELLQRKSPWLNATWFGARAVVYLAVWVWLGRLFLVGSVRQDADGDVARTVAVERFSPLALILLAVTTTFAAFDWIMSLEPTWYSTIFGVYFFSGAAVAVLSVLILFAAALRTVGLLRDAVTVEHDHDLGKLLFAFTVFWGYIAFSQYLLIWYGNIPEETEYYLHRSHGIWGAWSLALIIGHLVLPMVGLLSRHVKRRPLLLALWAAWLLVMHWADLAWLVWPSAGANAVWSPAVDAACLFGLGCLWLAGWLHWASHCSLVPLADPRLPESLRFENSY